MIEDIRRIALEAYVLHLMMWGELSDPEFYRKHGRKKFMTSHLKRRTVAMELNYAKTCEFCGIHLLFDVSSDKHANNCHGGSCPSKVGSKGGKCLGGLYAKWEYCEDDIERAKIASKIRDIKLADWFKKLIK